VTALLLTNTEAVVNVFGGVGDIVIAL